MEKLRCQSNTLNLFSFSLCIHKMGTMQYQLWPTYDGHTIGSNSEAECPDSMKMRQDPSWALMSHVVLPQAPQTLLLHRHEAHLHVHTLTLALSVSPTLVRTFQLILPQTMGFWSLHSDSDAPEGLKRKITSLVPRPFPWSPVAE